MNTLRRWFFAAKTLRSYVRRLNRCVEVEQILLDVANGKKEPLTKADCRALAFKLAGVREP